MSAGPPRTRVTRATWAQRTLLVALTVCLALCGLWLRQWWVRGSGERAVPDVQAGADFTTTPRANKRQLMSLPQSTASGGPVPAAPIIDAITIEKAEVCEGEENLITVRAHTPDGNDAFLHYQIGPTRGASVPLRSFLDDGGRATAHQVVVFSRNNVATTVPVPSYRVKRCDDAPIAVIDYRLLANSWADFSFEGRVVPTVPDRATAGATTTPFRPRLYRWSFGPGAVVESGSATITHSFAMRPQDTLYSSQLVTLEVISEADEGRTARIARARQSLELRNPAFEAFATKRIVQLMVELNPRFPSLSAAGVVEQGVRIWHTWPRPIQLTALTLSQRRMGRRQAADAPEHPPVTALWGGSEIPPGPGVEAHIRLDTTREPETLSLDYYLEGRTSEGYAVRGTFSVMRPPAPPTKEQHRPVEDPLLLAKIRRARELLHKEFVTDEDLWSLDRSGQFSGLRPE